ncbi:hypothetical protein WR25_19865 [Diploscapter pachys]|uniref:Uncharacterized protein n=1 Tax=Diploscapter pachys TaxID=2018661 RepID=A0A2A2JWD2_9BILA|nr:hypothetical protein WR25_19865 [Diploscapter pachys]
MSPSWIVGAIESPRPLAQVSSAGGDDVIACTHDRGNLSNSDSTGPSANVAPMPPAPVAQSPSKSSSGFIAISAS